MDFNQMLQSKTFKTALAAIGALVLLLLVFKAGVFVGYQKAGFSYRWGENYHRNFAGPRTGFMRGDWGNMMKDDFIDAHGAFGEIIEIKDNGFTVKGRGDIEKIVMTSAETVIKKGTETVIEGLKVGDRVVIIGAPNNDGQIEAKLIRVFDGVGAKLPYRPGPMRFF